MPIRKCTSSAQLDLQPASFAWGHIQSSGSARERRENLNGIDLAYTNYARSLELITSDGVARRKQEGQEKRWRNALAARFKNREGKKFNGDENGHGLVQYFCRVSSEGRFSYVQKARGVDGLGAGPAGRMN